MDSQPRAVARILLVDDHPILRNAVRQLISGLTDLTVCGEAASVQDALHAVRSLKPDLAIVDLSLGSEDGLDLVRRLRALDPRLPVVVFSMHERAMFGERAFVAGARGYVMKHEAPSQLIGAIREALATTGERPAPETP
jgi:DNA-binding NarL/FixJ family response regulator